MQGRVRVVALVLLLTLIPSFFAFYFIASARIERDAVATARRDVEAVTASLTDQLSRALETIDLVLLDVAADVGLDRGALGSILTSRRLAEMPHLRALLVTDSAGRVQMSTVASLVGADISDRGWMERATGRTTRLVVGGPEAGRYLGEPGRTIAETGRWTIPLARRYESGRDSARGIVLALLNPDYLTGIGRRASEAFGVQVRFFALDGTLLASTADRNEPIGERLTRAWLFRDFLPVRDSGSQTREDSGAVPAVAAFGTTASGLMAIEVARPMAAVLLPAQRRNRELAIGLAAVGFSTLLALGILALVGVRIAREQLALRQAEFQRAEAEREARLQRSARSELQRLLGGVPSLIFRAELEPDGPAQCQFIGGNIAAVTGWPSGEICGWDGLLSRIEEGDLPLRDFLLRVVAEGWAAREYRLGQPDGSWRWLHVAATVLSQDQAGRPEIVGHLADMTAEKAANAQLAAAGRLASLGEMATGLAHELRQPLAIMSLAAENLRRSVRDGRLDSVPSRVEKIVSQAQRASDIIEHLRRFARGTDPHEAPAAFPVADAVQGVLMLLGNTLREGGVEVTTELGTPPAEVTGHLLALEQVLLNLLINACHALEARPPGEARRIAILAGPGDAPGTARIEVRDTGGGIPPALLPRIFEPFVTTKSADKGTGLGLSICHGLVKGMKGRIEVRNEDGGAVFTITLPAPGAAPA